MVETDEDVIGVDLDKNVVQPGTHQIEVKSLANGRLQQQQALRIQTKVMLVLASEIYNGDGEQRLYIGTNDASLNGLAQLINKTRI